MFNNDFGIVENGILKKYHLDPRYELTHVSFPENWQGGKIEGVEFVKIVKTPKPICKLGWEIIEAFPLYDKQTNSWIQNWSKIYIGSYKLKMIVAEKRYNREISGIRIGNYVFKTDRESQTKYTLMALNNVKTFWKVNDTDFVYVSMRTIDKKVRNYVHHCFERERKFFEIIDTENMELIENTDFDSGWPNNGQE